jgi:8-oxo-dGTP pyrophosphatase MutT (NUDIX family)
VTDPWRFSVSVAGAVINDRGEFLAIQRQDNGHWEPPGGLVEPGESLEQALIREVLEETGLHIDPGPLSGVYRNMRLNVIAFVFNGSVSSGELQTSDETASVRWLTPAQVAEMMDEAYAVRLLDALEPGQVHTRTHDGSALVPADATPSYL